MIRFTVFVAFFFTSHICFGQNTGNQTELNYPQRIFDSDTCCWRKLSAENKYSEAGNLVVSYLKSGKGNTNTHSLKWHAGQLFAMAGNNDVAKKYFKKTYSVLYKWFGGEDGKTWYYYAKGTIAFIDKDKPKLENIIKKWSSEYPKDKNFDVLKNLLNNWGRSYKDAY